MSLPCFISERKHIIMSCKSAIYVSNTSPNAVAVNGTIPVGTTIRRYGCNIKQEGQGIVISGTGYYDISASITLLGTAAGTAIVQLYRDGVPIAGAQAKTTLAADTYSNVSLTALAREQCCNASSTITAVLSGVSATVDTIDVVIKKI